MFSSFSIPIFSIDEALNIIDENFVKTVEEIEARNKAFKEAYEAETKAQEEKR